MTKAERQTIANTIISQLGGGMFVAMTGSRNFVALESGVQFSVGHGTKDGINKVRVILEPSDTYTVEFYSVKGGTCFMLEQVTDVYCDSLQDVFERATGFYTTLAARR